MLPVAPPGGASTYVPTLASVPRASALPNDHVLLALPPTATSASVLRSLRSEGVSVSAVADGIGVLDAVRATDNCVGTNADAPPGGATGSITRQCAPVRVGITIL